MEKILSSGCAEGRIQMSDGGRQGSSQLPGSGFGQQAPGQRYSFFSLDSWDRIILIKILIFVLYFIEIFIYIMKDMLKQKKP